MISKVVVGALLYGAVVTGIGFVVAKRLVKRYRPSIKEMLALVEDMAQSRWDRDSDDAVKKIEELKAATDRLHGFDVSFRTRKKDGTNGGGNDDEG